MLKDKRVQRLARQLLDFVFPRLHLWLTQLDLLLAPKELDDVRKYLSTVITELRKPNEAFFPADAEIIPGQKMLAIPDGASSLPIPEIRRIRRVIRQILDSRLGGDSATSQLTLLNKNSRRVRNLVRFLASAKEPLVLLGDPGTGKSTTLREVGRVLAEQQLRRVYPSLVAFVPLGKPPSRKSYDANAIHDFIKKELPTVLRTRYNEFLNDRRLFVLFDGIDELPRQKYNEIVGALSDFGSINKQNVRTLYSCRINDFSPRFVHKQLVATIHPTANDGVFQI
jgi:predicted NACHT family NTPase